MWLCQAMLLNWSYLGKLIWQVHTQKPACLTQICMTAPKYDLNWFNLVWQYHTQKPKMVVTERACLNWFVCLLSHEITEYCVMSIHSIVMSQTCSKFIFLLLFADTFTIHHRSIEVSPQPLTHPLPLLSDMICKHWKIVYFRISTLNCQQSTQILEFELDFQISEASLELKLWNWSLFMTDHLPSETTCTFIRNEI